MKKYSKAIWSAVGTGLRVTCLILPISLLSFWSKDVRHFGMTAILFTLITGFIFFLAYLVLNITLVRKGQAVKPLTFKDLLLGDGKPW